MAIQLSKRQPSRAHPQALQVVDAYLPRPLVDGVYEALKQLPALPSNLFWVPTAQILAAAEGDGTAVEALAAYFGEPLASFLVQHMVQLLRTIPGATADLPEVLEFWTRNVSEHEPDVWLHVDSEVSGADWMQNVRNPIWGSILHLGPEGLKGGETCFCTEDPVPEHLLARCMMMSPEPEVRALSTQWIDVPHQPNRLIVFRGSLAHYAAPVDGIPAAHLPRVVLLVNLWDRVPAFRFPVTGVARVTPEEFRLFSRLTAAEMQQIDRREDLSPEAWEAVLASHRKNFSDAEMELLLAVLQRLE